MLAIVLGIWIVASIVVTPMIGYFLFALGKNGKAPKRSSPGNRSRAAMGAYLAANRRLYSKRTKPAERRAVLGPRAG
jgi:hypothetical protein